LTWVAGKDIIVLGEKTISRREPSVYPGVSIDMAATTDDNGTATTTTPPAKPRAPRPAGKAPGRAATGSKGVSPRKATGPADRLKAAREAANKMKMVADPTRLRVLLLLEDGEKFVGQLCEALGQSQPAVSHHIALLRTGGLIEPRRAGKNNYYSNSESGRALAAMIRALIG
jgi:DNA-binding transcriptional ArsR family regulator